MQILDWLGTHYSSFLIYGGLGLGIAFIISVFLQTSWGKWRWKTKRTCLKENHEEFLRRQKELNKYRRF